MKKIIICLVLLPLMMAAGVYKWTDENGNVHFGDRPADMNKAETVKIRKQTGSMVSNTQAAKYKRSVASNPNSDYDKAKVRYKKVLEGFYETENPSSACRYAVDLQDEFRVTLPGTKKTKRKVYLCPKE